MKNRKLIIFGTGETADIAFEYFTHDSEYDVVAFTVETEYLKETALHGLPVISFDELEKHFAASEVHIFVAKMCWHTMKYSRNAIQMSIASSEYFEPDYIRDYKEFQKKINK